MHTHDIIRLKESELVAQLKEMALAELEQHARNIMRDMGSEDYAQIMSKVMKAIEQEQKAGQTRFETVQIVIRESLPNVAYMSDIYARLAAIVMSILSRKFSALYQKS